MKSHPWFKQWANDWLADIHLRQCKWEGKGLLEDLMCLAHNGKPRGHVTNGGLPLDSDEIAEYFGEKKNKTVRLLRRLEDKKRIAYTPVGTIFIPSMVRETSEAALSEAYGSKGGSPNLVGRVKGGDNPTLNIYVDVETDTEEERKQRQDAFVLWWGEYPKHTGKKKALELWISLLLDYGKIMQAVADQKEWRLQAEALGSFMPHWVKPETWLADARWEDEKPPELKPKEVQVSMTFCPECNHQPSDYVKTCSTCGGKGQVPLE